ncbi:hypothetical protein JCM17823_29910 [Halorubrum gandharaense]
MQTFLTLPHAHDEPLPPWADAEPDLRLPRTLVDRIVARCSEPGDAVLDPFAGFGTTLAAAEAAEREAYGVEYDARRAEYVQSRLNHPERVVHGDAATVDLDRFPAVDLLVTSPPYMVAGMDANPFENYADESETSYDDYLDDFRQTVDRFRATLAPDATVVVEVSNLKFLGEVTPLAFDIAGELRTILDFRGEVVVGWTDAEEDGATEDETATAPFSDGERSAEDANGTYSYGYDHSYCLVFDA